MSLILSGTDGLSDVDGTAATPAIRGTDANTGIFFPAADTIAFAEGGVEAMRINSSGNLQTIGTISVGNATPSTSGAGITFPATQSASTDANTLDDYEEGNWTPSVGGSATYNAQQNGRYIKIGRLVWATWDMNINTIGTGNTQLIGGLPFTQEGNTPANPGGSVSYFASILSGSYFITPQMSGNNISFITTTSAMTTCNNGPAVFGNGTRLLGTVIINTAS